MEAETLSAIVSGSSALLGAIVGGAATYLSSIGQQRRANQRQRIDDRHKREISAAQACGQMLSDIAGDLEHLVHPARAKHTSDDTLRGKRAEENYKRFIVEARYLSSKIQTPVLDLGEILSETEDISFHTGHYGGTHYHSPRAICSNIQREIHILVAAFVNDQPIPQPANIILEYQSALSDLRVQQDQYYDMMNELDENAKDYDRRRSEFHKLHPQYKQ